MSDWKSGISKFFPSKLCCVWLPHLQNIATFTRALENKMILLKGSSPLEYPMYHDFLDFFLNCLIVLGNKAVNKSH